VVRQIAASFFVLMSQRFPLLTICAILFVIEVAIARHWIGNAFVRGYIGDVLVIGLIHFFVRGVFLTSPRLTAAGSVLFGFFVEGLQAFYFAEFLGLQPDSLLHVAIGNSFSVPDLLMYMIGGLLAYSVDCGLQSAVGNLRKSGPESRLPQ
jgi:hypothetical protein